ncbi:MAG: hypothetical protein KA739_04945 [Pseudomonadales bacterium]|nr:hypothetical protein [Gammaproteobacteria bacterium]MBP6051174.1 hypothetical protein [Pseudomonadales bacterium]MBK6584279.1 hypothetical protein [Gammaproteobacteria bacterium]MBK7520462.1 hypothetical protein [Gammaproteobacteria bacterium]MBK8308903.1 hypothetical protein [Gammaproteobacteria bacterium]
MLLATRRLGLVAFAWLICQTGHATANACWKELHFAASNSWVAATTVIQYQTMATATAVAELQGATALPVLPATSSAIGKIHVTFSAARSQGELDTWFDPGNGAVLQSLRTTQGRDRRQKLYRFASDGVWRERREPAPASGWIPTNSRQIAYPVTISTDDPVITPLMLIDHAARLVRDAQTNSSTHLVFTDTQLYRVTLELGPEQNLAAKFTLVEDGRETPMNESRAARRVSINAQLLGTEPEQDRFSLLELSGELAIDIDVRTAIPLRIQGSTYLGVVPVAITKAVLERNCQP